MNMVYLHRGDSLGFELSQITENISRNVSSGVAQVQQQWNALSSNSDLFTERLHVDQGLRNNLALTTTALTLPAIAGAVVSKYAPILGLPVTMALTYFGGEWGANTIAGNANEQAMARTMAWTSILNMGLLTVARCLPGQGLGLLGLKALAIGAATGYYTAQSQNLQGLDGWVTVARTALGTAGGTLIGDLVAMKTGNAMAGTLVRQWLGGVAVDGVLDSAACLVTGRVDLIGSLCTLSSGAISSALTNSAQMRFATHFPDVTHTITQKGSQLAQPALAAGLLAFGTPHVIEAMELPQSHQTRDMGDAVPLLAMTAVLSKRGKGESLRRSGSKPTPDSSLDTAHLIQGSDVAQQGDLLCNIQANLTAFAGEVQNYLKAKSDLPLNDPNCYDSHLSRSSEASDQFKQSVASIRALVLSNLKPVDQRQVLMRLADILRCDCIDLGVVPEKTRWITIQKLRTLGLSLEIESQLIGATFPMSATLSRGHVSHFNLPEHERVISITQYSPNEEQVTVQIKPDWPCNRLSIIDLCNVVEPSESFKFRYLLPAHESRLILGEQRDSSTGQSLYVAVESKNLNGHRTNSGSLAMIVERLPGLAKILNLRHFPEEHGKFTFPVDLVPQLQEANIRMLPLYLGSVRPVDILTVLQSYADNRFVVCRAGGGKYGFDLMGHDLLTHGPAEWAKPPLLVQSISEHSQALLESWRFVSAEGPLCSYLSVKISDFLAMLDISGAFLGFVLQDLPVQFHNHDEVVLPKVARGDFLRVEPLFAKMIEFDGQAFVEDVVGVARDSGFPELQQLESALNPFRSLKYHYPEDSVEMRDLVGQAERQIGLSPGHLAQQHQRYLAAAQEYRAMSAQTEETRNR